MFNFYQYLNKTATVNLIGVFILKAKITVSFKKTGTKSYLISLPIQEKVVFDIQ